MTKAGRYYRYTILYGSKGVSKEFATAKEAVKHAIGLKKSGFKGGIEVDRLRIYPHAKAGQTDWTQGFYKNIKKGKYTE
jgi:hypothetical protein